MNHEEALSIISRAWGRQEGYAFFPWISGDAPNREARIKAYHEGTGFLWPRDKAKILKHMALHEHDDLYWCPSLFETDRRQLDQAMDEHALWADLDAVDPRTIDQEYRPTIAWESSPGRYQALWLITGGDIMGASWQGGENQRLTYYLGADTGGWDTTQLLRIPGWRNHKFDHRGGPKKKPSELSDPPKGRLLWANGRRYLPDEFEDLPEVEQSVGQVQTLLEAEIDRVDRHEAYGRIRLKLPAKARDMFSAREATGDRSETLWWLMRCLADVGCSASEIVAIVRPSVWNKFDGRQDELKRLTIEATKAVNTRSEKEETDLEEEHVERANPVRIASLLANVQEPKWLVQGLWAEGSCGFIAGQPKSYKSWLGLEMALSVSSGLPFLNHFPVRQPGPVLYIQEEDPLPTIKQRFNKMWPGKKADKVKIEKGVLVWEPAEDGSDDPDVAAYVGEGFVISDAGWQSWLDEKLEEGLDGEAYRMLVVDPLMMVAGEVEENRAQEMTEKIFRPLKQLSRKHDIAVVMVHHMRKGDPARPTRGGQLMLGSVANHAWSEDSLYLRVVRGGDVLVERESKHTTSGSFKVSGLRNREWTPTVIDDKLDEWVGDSDSQSEPGSSGGRRSRKTSRAKVLNAMDELGSGSHTTRAVADQMNITVDGARKQLQRQAEVGTVKSEGQGRWVLAGTKG